MSSFVGTAIRVVCCAYLIAMPPQGGNVRGAGQAEDDSVDIVDEEKAAIIGVATRSNQSDIKTINADLGKTQDGEPQPSVIDTAALLESAVVQMVGEDCLTQAKKMDNAFPYHGSAHAQIANVFIEKKFNEEKGGKTGKNDKVTLLRATLCHDVGYMEAVATQTPTYVTDRTQNPVTTLDFAAEAIQTGKTLGLGNEIEKLPNKKPEIQKLGGGHEKHSIIKALQSKPPADDEQKRFAYAIALTKVVPPGGSADEVHKDVYKDATKGLDPPVVSDYFKAMMEASDFAYLTKEMNEDGKNYDTAMCGLLACFIEFHVFNGVAANTGPVPGAVGESIGQGWKAFKDAQAKFAYFVTIDKFKAVNKLDAAKTISTTPIFSGTVSFGSFPDDPPAGFGAMKAALPEIQTTVDDFFGKDSKGEDSTKFCELVGKVRSNCPAVHAGIKAVCPGPS